jgi:glycerophosphoryl diester phosphodiesterase
MPQFDDRKTTKKVDGKNTTGYFVSDFLYSELQELRLNQRLPERTTLYNGLLQIPSFTSIMSLAQSQYSSSGRTVGIYPELKHPSFFNGLQTYGKPMEDLLLDALVGGGFEVYGDSVPNDLAQVNPVVVQCFDPASLQYIHNKSTLPLILLLETVPASFWNTDNLNDIASYASGVGPEKSYFADVSYATAVQTIATIHGADLRMHPWTFRADQDIGARFHNDFSLELMYYYCCLGMDGMFSEFPDRSREAIDSMTNYTQWVQNSGVPVPAGQPVCPLDCASV